jgi:transcriptional regulator with XRE-family HTH domain
MNETNTSLTEYISRDSRRTLAKICVKAIGEDNPLSPISPTATLANKLGVTPRTINRWLSGGIQGSDANIERLLEETLHTSPKNAEETLRNDLNAHRQAVDDLLHQAGHGADPRSHTGTGG